MTAKPIYDESLETEYAVLGAMILDNQALIKALDILPTCDCFNNSANQILFQTLQKMSADGIQIDTITLAKTLRKEGTYEQAGGATQLGFLAMKVSTAAYVEVHSRILLEQYIRRKINQVVTEGLSKSLNEKEDIFEVAEFVQKGVSDVMTNNFKSNDLTMQERIEIERENRARKIKNGGGGISTGSKVLDSLTGGFVPTDFWVLGGRPGSGKTSWMTTTIKTLSMAGIPVGVVSLEMSGEQITQRILSNLSDVEAIKLRNSNTLSDNDLQRLTHYEGMAAKLPIYISDPATIRVQSIRTKAHIWKRKFGIQILFVDYLQKISGSNLNFKNLNRDQEMGEVSATLKAIAKELGITVVCLSSLNREVEKRSDKIPQLSDLRESGNIESDADQVLFLMRPEYYGLTGNFLVDNQEYPVDGLAVGSLAKNRHGSVGEFALRFENKVMRFADYHARQAPEFTQFPKPITSNGLNEFNIF